MLKGAVPLAALAEATTNYLKVKTEEVIDYWAREELEKAYQVYATGQGGRWGYEDGLQGEFDTAFALLGGGERQMSMKVIKHYCKQRGIDEDRLTDEERFRIIEKAKASLRDSWDKRIAAEAEMAAITADQDAWVTTEEDFIAQLK